MAEVRINKPKRSRGGAKRLDLTDMRELFKDRRMWTGVGIVTAPEGEEHWEIVQNTDGDDVGVLVEVVLQPSLTPVTCRLAAGIFDVPDEGDEVGVILPEGAADFMPVIVCRLSRAASSFPTAQQPQPGHIVIVRDQVLVHDGSGGAVALAKASELQAVSDDMYSHIHAASGSPTTKAIAEFTLPDPPGLPLEQPNTPGTTVLKGK